MTIALRVQPRVLAILACWLGVAAARGQEIRDPALSKRLAAHLGKLHEEGRFPGIAVSWILPGNRGTVAVGHADADSKEPLTERHRMLSGSVGKTYFAAVILKAVGDGKLALDDKLSKWLGKAEWFARLPNAADLTLRQCLMHRSGVPEHVRSDDFVRQVRADPDRTWKPEELVAFVLDAQPLSAAGERFAYADTNYILAGMAYEAATGQRIYDALQEQVLTPLGLKDTVPSVTRRIERLAQGHLAEKNPFGLPARMLKDGVMCVQPQLEWTGGGLAFTTADLAAWGAALYGGTVLGDKLTREMIETAQPTGRPRNEKYGLGVFVLDSPHGPCWGHSGWFPGWLTQLAHYPDHSLTIALQINSDQLGKLGMPLQRLADALAGVALTKDDAKSKDG